jgi:hypothetical protein
VGCGRAVFRWVLIAVAGSQLHDSLNTDVQGFQLLPDDALRHTLPRFFNRSRTQRSSGSVKVWKLTTSLPSRDRSALTTAWNPSAVASTTINFSPFSWAVRSPGQVAPNEARKLRVSLTPEIKMGVLLGRSPACTQVLVTWALRVLPTGMPLRGPDVARHAPIGSQTRYRVQTGLNPWLWA